MKRYQTKGIILRRTNYGEADRIINFITPDSGKVGAMAKGVRRPKSKLAGGIELFSVSSLSLIKGRGGMDRLVSTRLDVHYSDILTDYDYVEFGYKAIAMIDTITEEDAEEMYFDILAALFEELNRKRLALASIKCWFYLQLMRLHGYLPNLSHDRHGAKLQEDSQYNFDVSDGSFLAQAGGLFQANDIKAWRVMAQSGPAQLARIRGLSVSAGKSLPVVQAFAEHHLS